MIIFLIFGGVAADSSNAWRMRAELQATADAAAHAGVIDLIDGGPAARSAAIDMAEKNMDTSLHSNVLVPADVVVGLWNGATFTPVDDADVFTVNAKGEIVLAANAVMARTRRDANNSNRLKTYFLRLMGLDGWNVNALAIAQRYFPDCLSGSALVSAKIVDFQSNNKFHPGICIHAQDHVHVNGGGKPDPDGLGAGNIWLPGVHVTMPSLSDFYDNSGPSPNSGNQEEWLNTKNNGLVESLDEEWFYPKIVDSIPALIASYTDVNDPEEVWPSYIGTVGTSVNFTGAQLIVPIKSSQDWKTMWDAGLIVPGFIYDVKCKNPLSLGASATKPLQNVVVIASCKINVGSSGVVKNAVLASTGGDPKKPDESMIDVGSKSIIGDSVDCSNPGGVKLLSTAGVSGPGQTSYKGVQILAKGKVHIAAQADAKVEINVQSGGNIDFASNNEMGEVCVIDDDDLLRVTYYRLVL